MARSEKRIQLCLTNIGLTQLSTLRQDEGCATLLLPPTRAGMKGPNLGSVTGVIGRIPILDVEPAVDCGRRPAKAVTGESFEVSATIFREGHGIISAGVVLRDPDRKTGPLTRMRLLAPGHARWGAAVVVPGEGLWRLDVESWA